MFFGDGSSLLDDLSAKRVLKYFLLQYFEAPPANPALIELTPPFQKLFELAQNRKDVILFIVDAPLRVALDQLLNVLLDDCELQREVVLACQYFDDLAESQAGP